MRGVTPNANAKWCRKPTTPATMQCTCQGLSCPYTCAHSVDNPGGHIMASTNTVPVHTRIMHRWLSPLQTQLAMQDHPGTVSPEIADWAQPPSYRPVEVTHPEQYRCMCQTIFQHGYIIFWQILCTMPVVPDA